MEDGPKRATFGNGLEFLMSCISLSVGLGNIWRFPVTAYENGGGKKRNNLIELLLNIHLHRSFFDPLHHRFIPNWQAHVLL